MRLFLRSKSTFERTSDFYHWFVDMNLVGENGLHDTTVIEWLLPRISSNFRESWVNSRNIWQQLLRFELLGLP